MRCAVVVILTFIFGICVGIFIPIPMVQEIGVKTLYKNKHRSIIYNEEERILLNTGKRTPPNLSVIKARLTDESDNDKTHLGSNDKGKIICIVENIGEPAKNVRVNWTPQISLNEHQLKITRPKKTISKISQGGSEEYKISVETIGRKDAGRILITLEPIYIQKGQVVRSKSEPYKYELILTPEY